jgi:hypothetical protein
MAIQANNHRNCTLLLARYLLKSGSGKKEVMLRPVLCDHARGPACIIHGSIVVYE